MKTRRFLLPMLIVVTFICGCGGRGGGGGGSGVEKVTVSVTTAMNQTALQAGQTVGVVADVMHAGANSAVTWSVSGTTCPNNCGSVNSNASGEMYLAPEFVGATFQVTVIATSQADTSASASVVLTVDKSLSANCPSGNEAVLDGQYAFLLRGGGTPGNMAIAGSFTADGQGNITAGLEDINLASLGPQTGLTMMAGESLYAVGADNRGCLGVVNSQGNINLYRFALAGLAGGVATTGRMIEFDDTTGNGTRAEGYLAQQDPGSFSTAGIQGDYAFSLMGPDSSGLPMVIAGAIAANAGSLGSGNVDSNDGGTVSSNLTGVTGNYSVTQDGRGTFALSIEGGANFAAYMVSSSSFLVISSDKLSSSHALECGEFREQTLGTFNNTSLGAPAVMFTSGYDVTKSASVATVGSIVPDGAGNATVVLDTNDAGTFTPLQTSTVTYLVGTNGRATITSGLGQYPPVFYLVGANQGFMVGTDPDATSGFIDPQTGGPFSNASLSGAYGYGTKGDQVGARLTAVGSIMFDGTNDSATEDDSTPTGLTPNISVPVAQYSFSSSSSPPGRGVLDTNNDTVAYIISPAMLVYINTPAAEPRIVIVEK